MYVCMYVCMYIYIHIYIYIYMMARDLAVAQRATLYICFI